MQACSTRKPINWFSLQFYSSHVVTCNKGESKILDRINMAWKSAPPFLPCDYSGTVSRALAHYSFLNSFAELLSLSNSLIEGGTTISYSIFIYFLDIYLLAFQILVCLQSQPNYHLNRNPLVFKLWKQSHSNFTAIKLQQVGNKYWDHKCFVTQPIEPIYSHFGTIQYYNKIAHLHIT